jgi:hypothetical protein
MAKTWFISRLWTGLILERGDRVTAAVRKPDPLQDLQRIITNG